MNIIGLIINPVINLKMKECKITMPIPVILGVGAAIAAIVGIERGVNGAKKMKEANDTMESANSRHKKNISRFEEQQRETTIVMDKLGKLELDILGSFDKFSKTIEKIHNKPQFASYEKNGVTIPEYNAEELKKVSTFVGVLLGGIGGAAAGTAGGFAAAGATTAAVMALGAASTGIPIASLSGIAATNATLALLGGGTLAAGGGGIALGATILSAATFGVGLLVGGVIFSITGESLSNKADEAWNQMKKAENEIDKICDYLCELRNYANKYNQSLTDVKEMYDNHINMLSYTVNNMKKTDWDTFSEEQKLITENTVLLVGLLYNMCKVQMVLSSNNENEPNRVNKHGVEKSMSNAKSFLRERNLTA